MVGQDTCALVLWITESKPLCSFLLQEKGKKKEADMIIVQTCVINAQCLH